MDDPQVGEPRTMSFIEDVGQALKHTVPEAIPGVGGALGAVDNYLVGSTAKAKRDRIKHWKGLNSGTLTAKECAQLWVDAGGSEDDAPMAAAITRHESGGRVDVVNEIGATGLWQIHPGGEQYKNAWNNARAAVAKRRASRHKWGPNPWAVCLDDKCTNLQAEANNIAHNADLKSGPGGLVDTTADKAGDVGDGLAGAITGVFKPIAEFFNYLTQRDTWVRVGKVLLGVIIILFALNALTSGSSTTGAKAWSAYKKTL